MAYLTEAKLDNTIDLPVALPSTEIKMGDWLIFATIKLIQPQRLRFRVLNLQLHAASVDIADISSGNLIFGNMGLAYVVLRENFFSGSPGVGGAIDSLTISDIEVVSRDLTSEVVLTDPGTYSWVIANNCQADSSSVISTATSIDFRLSVTGQVRLELTTA